METLTGRERLLRTLAFQPVDRVPYYETPLWGQTYERWVSEGMPPMHEPPLGPMGLYAGSEFFGLDRREFAPIRFEALPPFTERLLAETDRTYTFVDPEGSTRVALKEGMALGTRLSMDTFVDFPVKNRGDWARLQWRYDPRSPGRYPDWWDERVRVWANRDYPLVVTRNTDRAPGLYSWLRRLMGTEAACTVFYDDPVLAEELLDALVDLVIETTHRALDQVQFDYFNIFEDFAGRAGPLVSPAIFKRSLLPRYRRIVDFMRSHGVQFISLDSDGDPSVLIPLMLEAGINWLWPLEVAAGMDALALRQKYGRDLALSGGIDKREIAKGRKEIERELYRQVPALLDKGGYIPHLDHDVPPDVSYDNYRYYLEIKRRIIEG